MKLLIACLIVILLFLQYDSNAWESSRSALRLEGRVTYTVYDGREQTNRVSTERFTMDVNSSGRYLIRLMDDFSGSDYFEVSYDGTNSYYLNNLSSIVSSRLAEKKPNAEAGGEENVATGIVRNSPVPQFSFAHCADPLWLAYASRFYFHERRQGEPVAPAASLGMSLQPDDFLQLPVIFELDNNGWLTRLSYVHPGEHLKTGRPLPSPFQSGFTNVNFRVDSFDTFSEGLHVPSHASMQTYYLSSRGSPNGPTIRKRIEYQIECFSAQTVSRSSFTPDLPGLTSVADERFNSPLDKTLHFSYRITDAWLSDEEVLALPQYQRTLGFIEARKPRLATVIFTFLLLNVAFVTAYLLFRRFNTKPQTEN